MTKKILLGFALVFVFLFAMFDLEAPAQKASFSMLGALKLRTGYWLRLGIMLSDGLYLGAAASFQQKEETVRVRTSQFGYIIVDQTATTRLGGELGVA